MKRKDLILIIAILLIALISYLAITVLSGKSDSYEVKVSVNGDEYARYDLYTDAEYEITTKYGTNKLIIKDGKAYVIEASCPDKICVNTGKIDSLDKIIVCLPNKLVVEIIERSN